MSKDKYPVTTAIRFLREHDIAFVPYEFEYEEKGGTRHTAMELGVEEHSIIKTIVMAADKKPLIVLMHGDKEISVKELARQVGVKTVEPADQNLAMKATGYQFGGTSPFGTKSALPIYAEASIFDLPEIYINGGKRGFIVRINPRELERTLRVTKVNVAI